MPSDTLEPRSAFLKHCLNFIFACFLSSHVGLVFAQDIKADGNTNTQVSEVNNVPVVTIAAPSAGGVSHNTFEKFNVNKPGAVLNNALVNGTSKLAGDLAANSHYSGTAASLILNEVTSTQKSQLYGETEIFGQRARYILANPYGISCDGCGFIRTPTGADTSTDIPEVTLSTGRVTNLNALTGAFSLEISPDNTRRLVIGAGGLHASGIDATTLMTRKLSIRGAVNGGKRLRIITGQGSLAASDDPSSRVFTASDENTNRPNYAIDATNLGAMQAGRIFIEATEAGVGVTLDGDLLATQGDIELNANGDLVHRKLTAKQNINISTGAGADLTIKDNIDAQGNLKLSLGGDARIQHDKNLDIVLSAAQKMLINCMGNSLPCKLDSKENTTLNAQKLVSQAAIKTAMNKDLNINAALDAMADIEAGRNLNIVAIYGDILNRQRLIAAGDLNLTVAASDGKFLLNGGLHTGGDLSLQGAGGYTHNTRTDDNVIGDWAIDIGDLINNGRLAKLKDGQLSATKLSNNGLIHSDAALHLKIDNSLHNAGDIVSLEGILQLTARDGKAINQVNNRGSIESLSLSQHQQPDASFIIDPHTWLIQHQADILAGKRRGAGTLMQKLKLANRLALDKLNANTGMKQGGVILISQLLNNSGEISGHDLRLRTTRLNNQSGLILAANDISIDGTELNNTNGSQLGVISSGRKLDIRLSGSLNNQGLLESGDIDINATTVNNTAATSPGLPSAGVIDTQGQVVTLGNQPRYKMSTKGAAYYRYRTSGNGEANIDSDLLLLSKNFLTAIKSSLPTDTLWVGDDVFMARLIQDSLRTRGGLPYIANERHAITQLQQLYQNTQTFMAENNLKLGQVPSAIQQSQLKASILVFDTQVINGQNVYTPNIYLAAGGTSKNPNKMDARISKIIARNNLNFKADSILNESEISAGNVIEIEAENYLQQNANGERAWMVDAQGRVQYRGPILTAGKNLLMKLRGDYQQYAGLVNADYLSIEAQDIVIGDVKQNSDVYQPYSVLDLIAAQAIANTAPSLRGGNIRLDAKGDLSNNGGLIDGTENIFLRATDDINNTGNIGGGKNVHLFADNIYNSRSLLHKQAVDNGKISAGGTLMLNAKNDIVDTAGRYDSGDNLYLIAGGDIRQKALKITRKSDEVRYRTEAVAFGGMFGRPRTRQVKAGEIHYSETQVITGSFKSGANLVLQAKGDLSLTGSDLTAAKALQLSGVNVNLNAAENRVERSSEEVGYRNDTSRTVTHEVVKLAAGGNISVNASGIYDEAGKLLLGGKLVTEGAQFSAGGSKETESKGHVILNASGDMLLLGVNEESYRSHQRTEKRSFWRKKYWLEEDHSITHRGTNITATGSVLINIEQGQNGQAKIAQSGNVVLSGAKVDAGGNTMIGGQGGVNVLAAKDYTYNRREYRNDGFFGINVEDHKSSKERLASAGTTLKASMDMSLLSGADLNIVGSDLIAGRNINLDAIGKILIAADQEINKTSGSSIKTSILSEGSLFKTKSTEEGKASKLARGSNIKAGSNIILNAESARIIASDLTAGSDIFVTTRSGDIEILSALESEESYHNDKEIRVDVLNVFSGLDKMVEFDEGRLKFKLAEASYDESKETTTLDSQRKSKLAANGNIVLSGKNILIGASDLTADSDGSGDGSLGLLARGNLSILDADEMYQSSKEEIHGKAAISLVVQNQFVEAAYGSKRIKEATEGLLNAKDEYSEYKKNLKTLKKKLHNLETDYANNASGVTEQDITNLRYLIADTQSDKAWYIAAIGVAVANVASESINLAQQSVAAAESAGTGTFGFNVGLQLDVEGNKTNSEEKKTTSIASNLKGHNILLKTGHGSESAKGSKTMIRGSHVLATNTLSIDTGELEMLAGKNTSSRETDHTAINLNVQQTVYGAAAGGPAFSAGMNKKTEKSNATNWTSSSLAGNNIQLRTSGDSKLLGADVRAKQTLIASIGGDLLMEAKQNRSRNSKLGYGFNFSGSFNNKAGKGESSGGSSLSAGMNHNKENSSDSSWTTSSLSGNNILLTTGGNASFLGADVRAKQDLIADIGGDLLMDAKQNRSSNNRLGYGFNLSGSTNGKGGESSDISLSAGMNHDKENSDMRSWTTSSLTGNNILLTTGGNARFLGADVRAREDLIADIGGDLLMDAKQNRSSNNKLGYGFNLSGSKSGGESSDVSVGGGMNHNKENSRNSSWTTSSLSGNNILLTTGGNAQFLGADIRAEQDLIAAIGGDLLMEAKQNHSSNNALGYGFNLNGSKSGSSDVTVSGDMNHDKENSRNSGWITSSLTGNNILLTTGGNAHFLGADVRAEQDLIAAIGGDLLMDAKQNRSSSNKLGYGFNLSGSKSGGESSDVSGSAGMNYDKENNDMHSWTTSSLTGNNILLTTGGNAHFLGADVRARKDLMAAIGGDLLMDAKQNRSSNNKLGYGFNLSGSKSGTGESSDVSGSGDMNHNKENSSDSSWTTSSLTGNNIRLTTGGNAHFLGADVRAREDLIADIGGDLLMEAKQNHSSNNKFGYGFNLSGSKSGGESSDVSGSGDMNYNKETSSDSSWTTSSLTGNNIRLTTGGNALFLGANVRAKQDLRADIGGDLLLESKQNRSSYNKLNFGFDFSSSPSEGNQSKNNNSADKNKYDTKGGAYFDNGDGSTRETVLSSMTSAGTAEINVGGNTQLTGALLATLDDHGNDLGQLKLSTNTLHYRDLSNASFNNEIAIVLNIDKKNVSNASYKYKSGSAKSTILATLGGGDLVIRDAANSSDLSLLNRDTLNIIRDFSSIERELSISVEVDHRSSSEKVNKSSANDFKQPKTSAIKVLIEDKMHTDTNLKSMKKRLEKTDKLSALTHRDSSASVLYVSAGKIQNLPSVVE